jgi:hypothetical protein
MEEVENFRDSPPSGPSSLSWDAFCNLLDNLPWDAIDPSEEQALSLSDVSFLREELDRPGQYFFQPHSSQHACEVFWLKLCVFESLCRQVALHHERTRRPLFQLDSRHIRVMLAADSNGYVPIRWRGAVMLPCSIEAPNFTVEGMPQEMAQTLSAVPADIDPVYVAPLIREWPHGREVRATALIESLDPIPDEGEGGIRGLLRTHLIADSIVAKDFSSRDVFCVNLPLGSGSAGIRLWSRKVASPERGVILSGVTDMLLPEMWRLLERNRQQVVSNARAVVYRFYSPACDLYSLGMLLLRTLVGSPVQRWNRLLKVLPNLVEGLAPAVQGIEASDHYTMHVRIRDYLHEQGDIFSNAAIAGDVWWDAIRMGLQAVTRIPGFSYEVAAADQARPQEYSSIKEFQRGIALLANRARIELFERDERDSAIRAACEATLIECGMA